MSSDNALPFDDIGAEELLYRSVMAKLVVIEGNTIIRLSADAFADRSYEASVDVASIRMFRPELTRMSPTDAVVSLLASEARSVGPITTEGPPPASFGVCV